MFSHCESTEEGTRNVVAECLGKLTLVDPLRLLPQLKVCVNTQEFGSLDPVHTTGPQKIENAALFLQLGLSSTLIRCVNGALRKRSSNRTNLKTLDLRFIMDGKHVVNGEFLKTRNRLDNHVINLNPGECTRHSRFSDAGHSCVFKISPV